MERMWISVPFMHLQMLRSDWDETIDILWPYYDRAGLTKDPLASAKKFTEKKQDAKESVRYLEADLRKLFPEAYPGEGANRFSVL